MCVCVCVVLFFSRMSLECELNYARVAASVVSIYVNFCTFIYIALKGEIHKKVNYLSQKKKSKKKVKVLFRLNLLVLRSQNQEFIFCNLKLD